MKLRLVLSLTLLFILLLSNNAFSQDQQLDELKFETTETKEENPAYFGVGVGYTGTFLFLNYDGINDFIKTNKLELGSFSGPLYMSGVHGFTAIGIIPNVRVGAFGMGGTKTLEKNFSFPVDSINCICNSNVKRTMDYSIGMTGGSIDWAFLRLRPVFFLVGLNAGAGYLNIESYQNPTSNVDYTKVSTSKDNVYYDHFKSTFFFMQPTLNVEWAISTFTTLRGNVSYNWTAQIGDWKYNNSGTLSNVPDKINGKGLTVQLGLFVGLFN